MEILQHLINGLSIGSIYALIALGYTMVYGVLRLINFAHSEVYMVGAFTGYYTATWLGFGQESNFFHLIIILLLAMTVCAGLGYGIERVAYRPMRKTSGMNSLITAVGISLFLQYAGQLVFGADPKFFPQVYQSETNWSLGEVQINPLQVMVAGVAVILMIILHVVIFHSKMGRAMRAVSFSEENARLMGVSANKVISFTFMLGSSLAGAAGVLVGLVYPRIDPLMGMMPGLKAFVAAVVGGIGNVVGAVFGALLLGLSEEFVVAYGKSTFRDALAFVILILILLLKPGGLLGKSVREKV